jgi:hypothetical protein
LQDSFKSHRHLESDVVRISHALEEIFSWLSKNGTVDLSAQTETFEWSFNVLSSMLAKAAIHTHDNRHPYGIEVDGSEIRTHYTFSSPPGPAPQPRYGRFKPIYCTVGHVISVRGKHFPVTSKSIVLQSGAQDFDLSHEDVIEYFDSLEKSDFRRILAIIATSALCTYRAWDSYIATSEKFARLLVRGSQIYTYEDLAIDNTTVGQLHRRQIVDH